MTQTRRLLLGFLAVLLLSGCAKLGIGFTKISELHANPQKFTAKEVSIKGKVVNAMKLPLVQTRIYAVQDETGAISVQTEAEPPAIGAEVKVKGTLDTLFVMGLQRSGPYLKEIERW
jgi:hypothetical protein